MRFPARLHVPLLAASLAASLVASLTAPAKAQQPPASPRDTTRAMVGAASVLIDYGRPSKRGREIWGGLVPYDTAWRLGANTATHIRTDKDLEIGGVTVPAGLYTLFLLPTRTGATLLVNSQTGQWGTAYDASKDLYRIPMTRRPDAQAVEERLTIRIEGGTLLVLWDRGGFSTSIKAK